MPTVIRSKFDLGSVVFTPAVMEAYGPEVTVVCLKRHATGDWGDTPKEDAKMNEEAVTSGDRIMSSYKLGGEDDLWVITEGEGADRVTTVLLASDY